MGSYTRGKGIMTNTKNDLTTEDNDKHNNECKDDKEKKLKILIAIEYEYRKHKKYPKAKKYFGKLAELIGICASKKLIESVWKKICDILNE